VEGLMDLKNIYQKIGRARVLAGYVFGVIFFIFSKPHFSLFYIALPFILAGIFLRTWSAGTIVKKSKLITIGPYSLVRHPLYLGSFLIGIGFTILGGIEWMLGFLFGFFIFYFPKIIMEEETLKKIYGDEYERYKRETPLFFPKTLRFRRGGFRWEKFKGNKEYNVWLGVSLFLILYYLKAVVING
jgi:protein-S-isoprenylcysteine O-methyltransferase Ste14